MEIASRSLERILQNRGIEVKDGELALEMHFDPTTFNLRIIISSIPAFNWLGDQKRGHIIVLRSMQNIRFNRKCLRY